jgi:hypothetical protein
MYIDSQGNEIKNMRATEKMYNEIIGKTVELGLMKGGEMAKSLAKATVDPLRGFNDNGELTDGQTLIKNQRKEIDEIYKSYGRQPNLLDGFFLGAIESFSNPIEVGAGLLSGGVMSGMGLGVVKTILGEGAIDLVYDNLQTKQTENRWPTLEENMTNLLVNLGFQGASALVKKSGFTSPMEQMTEINKNPKGIDAKEVNIQKTIEETYDNLTGIEGSYSAEIRINSGDHTTFLQQHNKTQLEYNKNIEMIKAKELELKAINDQLGVDVKLTKDGVKEYKDSKMYKEYEEVFTKKKAFVEQEIQNLKNNNKDLGIETKPHIKVMSENLHTFMTDYNEKLKIRENAVSDLATKLNINPSQADKMYGKKVSFDDTAIENIVLKVDSKYQQDIRQAHRQYNILLGENVNDFIKSDKFSGNTYEYGDLIYGGLYELENDKNVARLLKQADIDNSIIYNRSRGGDGGKLATIVDKRKVMRDFNSGFINDDVKINGENSTIKFESYANDVVPEGFRGKIKKTKIVNGKEVPVKVKTVPREEYAEMIINKDTWPEFKKKLSDITKSNPVGAHHVEAMYSKKRREFIQAHKDNISKQTLVEHGAEVTPENIKKLSDQMDMKKLEKDGNIITDEVNEKIHDEIYHDVAVDMHTMMSDISNSRLSERGKTNIETMGIDQIAKNYPIFGGENFFFHTPYRKNNMEIITDIYNNTAHRASMLQNYGEVDGFKIREDFKKDFRDVLESENFSNRTLNQDVEQDIFLNETNEIFGRLVDDVMLKNSNKITSGQKIFDGALNLVRWKVMAGSGITEFITNPTMVDVRMSKYANINSILALSQTGQGIANADSKYIARAAIQVVDAKSKGNLSSGKSKMEKFDNFKENVNDYGYIFQEKSDVMTQMLAHASITKMMNELPVDFSLNSNEVIDALRRSGVNIENYADFRKYSKAHIEGNGTYLDPNQLTDIEHFGSGEDQIKAGKMRAFYNDVFFDVGSPVNRKKVMSIGKGNVNKMQMTFRGWSRSMGDQGLKRMLYAKNGRGALVGRASKEGLGLTYSETKKKISNNFGSSIVSAGIALTTGIANQQAWNYLYGDVTFAEAIAVMKAKSEQMKEAYNNEKWGQLTKEIVLPAILENSGVSILSDGGYSFDNEFKNVWGAIFPYMDDDLKLKGENVSEGLKATAKYGSEIIFGTKIRRFANKLANKTPFLDERLNSTHLKGEDELFYLWQGFQKEDTYDQKEMDKTYRMANVVQRGPVEITDETMEVYNQINKKLKFTTSEEQEKKKELQFMMDSATNGEELLYYLGERWGISEDDL